MNQILVTEKLYITPELKRKKKIYKFYFIISIFLVAILTYLYIYAEYDRNKSEETSQLLLAQLGKNISTEEKDTTTAQDDILMIILNKNDNEEKNNVITINDEKAPSISEINDQAEMLITKNGYRYKIISTIEIPKLSISYTVVQGETKSKEETEELLKISPVKFHGHEPNEVGNFCIAGHNYRNTRFFSKVPTLENGDIIKLTDLTGRTISYEVYDKHTVEPDDTSDTTQLTGGRKEVTLITCTDDNKLRVIVRCKEVK